MEMKVNTDVKIITVKVTRENYYDTFLIERCSYFMIALKYWSHRSVYKITAIQYTEIIK